MNTTPYGSKARAHLLRQAVLWMGLMMGFVTAGRAQVTVNESFTGTTASGWVFGGSSGSTSPYLTANTVDTAGTGWLRLTENTGNQATYALFDSAIFSVNAQIQIEMDYTFWNGSGADGITFFMVDGSVDASTFQPGGYGGSLGYAQNTVAGAAGMPGGYLGFGLDDYGNYSSNSEGRNGGLGGGLFPNRVAVRGPESSNYEFIAASPALETLSGGAQMDFPATTTRPDQTGADYRSFRLTLDANNQLTVEMKFGASGNYITAFTADLSSYDRPDTFKIGFTGSTGGSTEIHEVRNVSVTMTPWQPGSFEWDNGAGTTAWGATPGGANNNWYHSESGSNNKTPTPNADILFGNKPSTNQTVTLNTSNTKVNSLTFDAGINYTVNGTGSLVMGDTSVAGLPSINVNDYNGAQAQHSINVPLTLVEDLRINNYSFSTLCLKGAITTGGNDLKVNGNGATNFNGDIIGSGDLIKNGTGIVTINSNNSDGATPWAGNVTINEGMVVVTANGALGLAGTAVDRSINQASSSGTSTIRLTSAQATGLVVGQAITGTGIAPGTVITGIATSGSNRVITLSNPLTAAVSNGASFNFSYGDTIVNDGGTLAFRDTSGSGLNYSTAEVVTISGQGVLRGGEGYAGAIYNDGGNNKFAGNITMAANSAIGSRDGVLTLGGQISGGYGLTKLGAGVVELTNGANNWSGATRIEGGALRISTSADALPGGFSTGSPSGGNLQLAGGVLEVGVNATFSRRLGTAADQVQWVGDGGFSASGGNRTFTLTNSAGAANGALTWNAGSFVPTGNALLLSSDYASGMTTLTNAINFGGANREVRVANGSAAVDATLSGILSNGGLIKTGAGTLNISGANTYTGTTEIRDGALRGVIGGGNITLNGGVLEITNNFTRNLGAGAGEVQWIGDGGFAAYGSNRSVSLNNNSNAVVWASTPNFVGNGSTLILGSNSANRTVTLTNGINLNNGNRTVKVQNGSAAIDGILSGVVSNGSLTVEGKGRLDMTAANTLAGSVTVQGAELRLQGTGTMGNITSLAVKSGGTFTMDNAGTNNTNRVNNSATVSLQGGTISMVGNSGANSSETVGALTLVGGANTIDVARAGSRTATLTFGSVTRNAGATLNIIRPNASSDLRFTTSPTLDDGILAYATVNGTDFATHTGNNTDIAAYTSYGTGNETTWTSGTVNAAPTGVQALAANRTVGSLKLGSGIDVTGSTRTLTIDSGGLLSIGNDISNISVGTLNIGGSATELITHVYGSGGLNISSVIANNSGADGLTKTGDGELTLSGSAANTFTGTTYVNDGTLALNKTAGVNAIAGNIIVGDGRGTDILRLDADEQIKNTANVTLRGADYGGETKLQFNGAGGAGITETLGTLTIDGTAVIDFAGGAPCDANFLYLDDLLMSSADSTLFIRNWIDFTDFLLVRNTADVPAVLSQIAFEGYGNGAYWEAYDSQYSRITPVPEPTTYGAIMMAVGLGCWFWRRRRAAKAV